jgi:TPR repeat protein
MHNHTADHSQAKSLPTKPEQLLRLGMMCSTGRTMPLDMVAAHKWFNIAASLGVKGCRPVAE